jgi:hypothetical protein
MYCLGINSSGTNGPYTTTTKKTNMTPCPICISKNRT